MSRVGACGAPLGAKAWASRAGAEEEGPGGRAGRTRRRTRDGEEVGRLSVPAQALCSPWSGGR